MMLVCDYLPKDDSERESALYMTAQEQLAALKAGGFDHADVVFVEDGKAVYRVKKLPS